MIPDWIQDEAEIGKNIKKLEQVRNLNIDWILDNIELILNSLGKILLLIEVEECLCPRRCMLRELRMMSPDSVAHFHMTQKTLRRGDGKSNCDKTLTTGNFR